MKYLIFSGFTILFFLTIACSGSKEIKDATLAYNLKKYDLAIKLFPDEITKAKKQTDKYEKIKLLADAYLKQTNYKQAEEWLQQLYDERQYPEDLLALGKVQMQTEDFEQAIKTFQQYIEESYDRYYGNQYIKKCQQALDYLNGKTNISLENPKSINSSGYDFSPVLYKNNQIVFSSTHNTTGDAKDPWTGEKAADLFITEIIDNQNFSRPESFSSTLNSELWEGNICFNKTFDEVYFTRCGYSDEENGYCQIFYALYDGLDWSEPEILKIFPDSVNAGQPYLSPDGQRLYFSSDAPDGFGGKDIYYIEKDNFGGWSEYFNAGFKVNTEGDDMFPIIDKDGNLYYASNGKVGFGGLDIYVAQKQGKGFNKPYAMPYPINSGGDDFGFVWLTYPNREGPILEQAILSSNRKGSLGFDDIYQYLKMFKNYFELEVKVVEKNYKDPNDKNSELLGMKDLKGANIQLTDIYAKLIGEKTSKIGRTSNFELVNDSEYKLFVSKEGYFNKTTTISTAGKESADSLLIKLFVEIELEKIFPEEITIENIYYDFDKATLRPESLPLLDELVSFFEENNDLLIEIGSHTDARGSDEYNLNLSQRRAQSVVNYLISQGVERDQLSAKGYGETKILNGCVNGVECSEEEHQANRRTTFSVIFEDGVIKSE